MCDEPILENGGKLKSAPNCYKNQEMCNKTVNNYPHASEFVLECYQSQKLKILTILRLIHFYFLLSFRFSLQEHFQNYIFFPFSLT